MSFSKLTIPPARYGVIITCREIDRFAHNELFAHELILAMRHHGMPVLSIDYRSEAPALFTAVRDPNCAFMLCFNGFGSELTVPFSQTPGSVVSVFSAFQKPLLDFMHDCPAHDTMKHQVEAKFSQRIMLLTDHGYAHVARSMGFPNVIHMPSITFPATLGPDVKPISDRGISVLLPISLPSPRFVFDRFIKNKLYKQRIYATLFDSVTEAAVGDWTIDPLAELQKACREADCELDLRGADGRFLLTAVVDYVKFERRRRLLRGLAKLPVTVLSDRDLDEPIESDSIHFMPLRSASELLHTMADSKCVICPTPHMTGFHERVLGAFTAGATVVSSPNEIVETNFLSGAEYVFFRNEDDLAANLESLLDAPAALQSIASAGRARAMSMFDPIRFAATLLSLLATRA